MSEKPELSAVQQWILQAQREILSRDKAHKDGQCSSNPPSVGVEEPQTPANNTAA